MTANTLENWANFFVTTAEVAATLAGLVIVAVSVNIQQILKHPQLPPRASSTVAVLMLAVVIGLAALIPQPVPAFAAEIFVAAAVTLVLLLICARAIVRAHMNAGRSMWEVIVGLPGGPAAAAAFLAGATLLWTGHANGLYWIAAGIVVALLFAVLNAWVFLIEVLR
jgi:modulator of FtsH protease